MSYFLDNKWAVSSAVEHCFHTAGVTGSIPVPPTKNRNGFIELPCFSDISGNRGDLEPSRATIKYQRPKDDDT
jgi:hypothetical protein